MLSMVSGLDHNNYFLILRLHLSKLKQVDVTAHCGDGCLFNIKEDPYEYENLATKMPDVLAQMQKKLTKYQDTYFNPDRGKIWPGACETALNKYGGFWGPFEP